MYILAALSLAARANEALAKLVQAFADRVVLTRAHPTTVSKYSHYCLFSTLSTHIYFSGIIADHPCR